MNCHPPLSASTSLSSFPPPSLCPWAPSPCSIPYPLFSSSYKPLTPCVSSIFSSSSCSSSSASSSLTFSSYSYSLSVLLLYLPLLILLLLLFLLLNLLLQLFLLFFSSSSPSTSPAPTPPIPPTHFPALCSNRQTHCHCS